MTRRSSHSVNPRRNAITRIAREILIVVSDINTETKGTISLKHSEVVKSCGDFKGRTTIRYFFHIELPAVQLQRRFETFLVNAADDDKVY